MEKAKEVSVNWAKNNSENRTSQRHNGLALLLHVSDKTCSPFGATLSRLFLTAALPPSNPPLDHPGASNEVLTDWPRISRAGAAQEARQDRMQLR